MFDTPITVVGNVLAAPEWRRTRNTNALVVNFKVASTARRYDKETGRWVDGDSLRVRVVCWRKLAENVALSVMVGDPVIVSGRLYTREWTDEQGQKHLSYELEAVAVGHDLARGVGKFARRRGAASTDVVDGPGAEAGVAGELSDPVDGPDGLPDLSADELFDDEEVEPVEAAAESRLAPATVG